MSLLVLLRLTPPDDATGSYTGEKELSSPFLLASYKHFSNWFIYKITTEILGLLRCSFFTRSVSSTGYQNPVGLIASVKQALKCYVDFKAVPYIFYQLKCYVC